MKNVCPIILIMMSTSLANAQDDFGLEILEGEVTDADSAAYDEAKSLLNQEQYIDAITAFEEIRANPEFKDYHEQAQYDVAKALYRLGLFHSAIARYTEILKAGPSHPFFENSREWLFFIARRIDDRQRVVGLIAKYAKAKDVPPEYAAELNYQLARFHFINALDDSAWVQKDDEIKDTDDGGGGDFDFSGTDLDDDGDGKDKDGKGKDDDKVKDDDDGGFSFDEDDLGGADDDFDLDLGDLEDEDTKKGKKSKKSKRGKKESFKLETPSNPEEALEQSLKNLERVDEGFAQYHKALYLKGLVYYAQEKFEPAVEAFRGVVRMTQPGKGRFDDPALREMAFFSLARVHYQFEQFRYAIFYYDRISRDSEAWLDALFESSWAHFRLGQFEKALGNLVTLQSPFFEDEYYPESHILKAITFYENCRYPEASSFLNDFRDDYQSVIEELGRMLGDKQRDPAEVYEALTSLAKGEKPKGDDGREVDEKLTRRILRLAFADKRILNYQRAIDEVDGEVKRLEQIGAPFAGTDAHAGLLQASADRRKALVAGAGRLLMDKLRQERKFLRNLSSKLVRIQFEITKSEKLVLEDKLRNKDDSGAGLESYNRSTATDDERVYWPFPGEYWRDELGTYEYTLTRGCRPPNEDDGDAVSQR